MQLAEIQGRCGVCRNADGFVDRDGEAVRVCSAFPDGVPDEISIDGAAEAHRLPYPGDHGIRFEPAEQPAKA